ncbi:MAG: ATP-grasp domain-containing protein, partial [Candidatus Omnitrophica bacterium]|nr:ATP-grasp domain-containing protein [Candidatus Omnitrophota bacterium]
AEIFSFKFPSLDTVINCRSKYTFKKIIKDDGIACPEVFLIRNQEDAARLFDHFEGPAIIKPLTGSGSELVFKCEDKESCRAACSTIMEKMKDKRSRMYSGSSLSGSNDPHEVFVMEQFIPGDEYSCDFIFDDGKINILRLTKKIINNNATFGTVSAYILPAELPEGVTEKMLRFYLYDVVKSLDEKRIMAMADLKIFKGEIFILELTPRPGGDCLPFLIKESSGFDIFGAALDFAEGKPVYPLEIEKWKKVIGLHLLADKNGILKDIDDSLIVSDERVIRCDLKHSQGDRIVMPPNDYESRLLGHVFFRPYPDQDLEKQCEEISQKLIFEMELNDEHETAAR